MAVHRMHMSYRHNSMPTLVPALGGVMVVQVENSRWQPSADAAVASATPTNCMSILGRCLHLYSHSVTERGIFHSNCLLQLNPHHD